MKVNDYIRTEDGGIGKVIEIICSSDKKNDNIITDNNTIAKGWDGEQVNDTYRSAVVKSSPNIIDLIEIGDYINGSQVVDIAKAPKKALYTEDIRQKGALIPIINNEIESIITKERFEEYEYKIGE